MVISWGKIIDPLVTLFLCNYFVSKSMLKASVNDNMWQQQLITWKNSTKIKPTTQARSCRGHGGAMPPKWKNRHKFAPQRIIDNIIFVMHLFLVWNSCPPQGEGKEGIAPRSMCPATWLLQRHNLWLALSDKASGVVRQGTIILIVWS